MGEEQAVSCIQRLDLFHLLILGLVFVLAATGLVSTIPLLVSTALCGILRQLFLARKGKAGDPS